MKNIKKGLTKTGKAQKIALPCLALPCLALPCLALPCLALPCLVAVSMCLCAMERHRNKLWRRILYRF